MANYLFDGKNINWQQLKALSGFRYSRIIQLLLALIIASNLSPVYADELAHTDNSLLPAIVLDYEMRGDTSVETLQENDRRLMKKFSAYLRDGLKDRHIVNVINDVATQNAIHEAAETQNLQSCNGCELNLSRDLGAKQVVVPWLFRMSILIQTMYIEIRDVETGNVIVHIGRNFRGNTDEGWERAANSLLNDLDYKLNHQPQ